MQNFKILGENERDKNAVNSGRYVLPESPKCFTCSATTAQAFMLVSTLLVIHEKSSKTPGPSHKFVSEDKLNNLVYFVYTWPPVCQSGLSRGFVDYSDNGEHTDHTHTHRGSI